MIGRVLWMVSALAAGAVLLSGCAAGERYEVRQTASAAIDGVRAVMIQNDVGAISVSKGGGERAFVDATLEGRDLARLESARVTADLGVDGVLRIGVDWPGGERASDESVGLEVSLMRAPRLFVRSGSGGVAIGAGLRGDVRVDSGSGGVSIEGHNGPVEVTTGTGAVGLSAHRGDAVVRSGSGAISVVQAGAGGFDLKSGSGAIAVVVDDATVGTLEIEAASGAIDLGGLSSLARSTEMLEVRPGRVVVRLGGRDEPTLRIQAGSGAVSVTSGRAGE